SCLCGFNEITTDTKVYIGFFYARGHNASGIVTGFDIGRFKTTLLNTDFTLRWRPLQRSIYRSFVGMSEFTWSRRGQPNGTQSARGYSFSGTYQFPRRWYAGFRYDRSAQADNALLVDKGQSAL